MKVPTRLTPAGTPTILVPWRRFVDESSYTPGIHWGHACQPLMVLLSGLVFIGCNGQMVASGEDIFEKTGHRAATCCNEVYCVENADCPDGYHCNTNLIPPECQRLYCGPLESICDEHALCAEGALCSKGFEPARCSSGLQGDICSNGDESDQEWRRDCQAGFNCNKGYEPPRCSVSGSAEEGQVCGRDEDCNREASDMVDKLFCNTPENPPVCRHYLTLSEGTPCLPDKAGCITGLICYQALKPPSCHLPAELGEPCGHNDDCKDGDGLFCNTKYDTPQCRKGDPGDLCYSDKTCDASRGLRCNESGDVHVCLEPSAIPGGKCEGSWDCPIGYFCTTWSSDKVCEN